LRKKRGEKDEHIPPTKDEETQMVAEGRELRHSTRKRKKTFLIFLKGREGGSHGGKREESREIRGKEGLYAPVTGPKRLVMNGWGGERKKISF